MGFYKYRNKEFDFMMSEDESIKTYIFILQRDKIEELEKKSVCLSDLFLRTGKQISVWLGVGDTKISNIDVKYKPNYCLPLNEIERIAFVINQKSYIEYLERGNIASKIGETCIYFGTDFARVNLDWETPKDLK